METEEDCPPAKKLKQGRLPFKPLDHAGQTMQGNTPPGSKKRKLSDNESPSAKQIKTSVFLSSKPQATDGEPEVSSSSEADTVSDPLLSKPNKRLNTLDKFFKPKLITHDQEEITSTNECIEIDLTNDNVEEKDHVDCSSDKSASQVSMSTGAVHSDAEIPTKTIGENDDKENEETSQDDDTFIENTSVCEDALKTPTKGKLPESVLKTPVAGTSSSNVTMSSPSHATIPSHGQESANGSTPISGRKKPKAMSESKRKERDAQKEEQRLQKEKEKEEKKKELLEKKQQKEKEKAEKERIRLEEKEKKEKERLEKVKQKEEEKKQKDKESEAKLEEKLKKEEERKQKDEERKQKEEEKLKVEEEKQRKADKKKEKFKGFFIKKDLVVSPPKLKEIKNGLFMPFELKTNMKLAPERRGKPLSRSMRDTFDEAFSKQDTEQLYLNTIKSATHVPGQCGETWPRECDEDSDVELLSHEKETIEKVTHYVKFLYFHENTRPPYFGTWRKRSKLLSGRNPFKQDETLFDYEVDSDDEWEEEEPGESVSSDEEEEKEEGDKMEDEDPDADDWMVPHGYLSDDEGLADEEVDVASKQDLQKVRQAAWESELKRQAKPLRMLAIGCEWENDDTTTIAAQQLRILLKYKAVCLTEGPIDTSFSRTDTTDFDVACSKSEKGEKRHRAMRKSVPEDAIPDLIRLVHGNPVGIKNLIKEFRMFWKKKTNPTTDDCASTTLDSSTLDISMEVDVKPDNTSDTPKSAVMDATKAQSVSDTPTALNESKSDAPEEFAISKRQLEIKIPAIATREKRSDHKKTCWYVKDEILEQYNMADIKLPNSWDYVCIKLPAWAQDRSCTPKVEESSSGRATPNIMQFAQPMSLTQIQALGPVIKDTIETVEAVTSAEHILDAVPILAPGKPVVPDQRSIKDMFSPAAKKRITLNKNMDSPKSTEIYSSGLQTINNKVSPNAKKSINDVVAQIIENSPKSSGARASSTIKKSPVGLKLNVKSPKICGAATSSTIITSAASGTKSVLAGMLSSPELMKPHLNSKLVTKQTESTRERMEHPMEVDIIVLD